MDSKDILKLRRIRDLFKDLSDEYYCYSNDENIEELERVRYKGRSQGYDLAVDRIDILIENEMRRGE